MKIIICPTCDGKGETKEDIGTHTSEYVYSTCERCRGTGRMKILHIDTYLEIPFGASENKVQEVQQKVFDIINNFKKLK